jgi:hypothetical protein
MTAMTKIEVLADIWYDATHVVGYKVNGDEIEGPRWVLVIETPDGEMTWSAKNAMTLVGIADRWGHDRGVHVMVKLLNPVGG